MAFINSLKLSGAIAAGVLALGLSAPAQASSVTFDWVFQTAGVSGGGYGTGNILLTVDTTATSPTVSDPKYNYVGYNIVGASGSIKWTDGSTTITTVINGLINAALGGNPGDNVINLTALSSGATFAWDSFGIALTSATPGLDFNLFSTRTNYDIVGITSADGYATGTKGDDYTTVNLPLGLSSNGQSYQLEQVVYQNLTQVPAPLPLALLGVGLAGVGFLSRRPRQS